MGIIRPLLRKSDKPFQSNGSGIFGPLLGALLFGLESRDRPHTGKKAEFHGLGANAGVNSAIKNRSRYSGLTIAPPQTIRDSACQEVP